jgi:hypothetical protein
MIAVLLLAAIVTAVSVLLLLPRRTRRSGVYGLLTALPFTAAFYAGIVVANQMGAWDRPMVPIGPDTRANFVVIFKPTATNRQINSFIANVIGDPHPRAGHSHLPGMQSLLKVDVSGYEAYAIGFTRDITNEQKQHIRTRIRASPIVLRLFENVDPSKIEGPAG